MFLPLLFLITFVSPSVSKVPLVLMKAEQSTVVVRGWVQATPLDEKSKIVRHGPFHLLRKRVVVDSPIEVFRNKAFCSGVVIDSDGNNELILTARHCDNSELYDTKNGHIDVTTVPTSVVFSDGDIGVVKDWVNDEVPDENDDLFLMRVVSKHSHKFIKINDGRLYPLQSLFGIGMPRGNPWSFIRLSVSQDNKVIDHQVLGWKYTYNVESPAMDHGMSGGGVFNYRGELVGIMVGFSGINGTNVMIPSFRVHAWLKTLGLVK